MNHRLGRHLPYYLLLAFLINFVILALLSEGSIGGADDISHFKFSRYGFKYPGLFLDPWAKPLFTMLTAPFAQLGMIGVRFFNILIGLGAALLTYITAKKLTFKHPVLSLFMLVFTPIYSALMISGMTEILFSFILILGIYLFFMNRSIWSSVVVSLLPFVRTEGFVILPLFFIACAVNRQWKAIPFLATGFLFFSIIGSFHYHDFFWVINTMPYTGDARDIYGSGELLYYVQKFRPIFGPLLFFLILWGLLYIPIHLFTGRKYTGFRYLNLLLVGFLPFLVYFAAHSYVWWRGTGNSVGETRVMAAVFPSAVLLALSGWDGLLRWMPLHGSIKIALSIILAVILVFSTFMIQALPVGFGPTQQLVLQAAKWLKGSPYAGSKTIYFDPHWWYFMDIDPKDQERGKQFMPDLSRPQKHILPGELVVWDAHYGPNEGRLPLDRLINNPCFEMIKVFRPEIPFQVLGGYDYQICIFKRIECEGQVMDQPVPAEWTAGMDSFPRLRVLAYHDYEDAWNRNENLKRSREAFHSGSSSLRVDEDTEFVEGIHIAVKYLGALEGAKVMARFYHRFDEEPEGEHPLLVISLENAKQPYFYQAWEINPDKLLSWEMSQYEHAFPQWMNGEDVFKVYIWNRGRCRLYIDDFAIGLKECD